MYQNYIGCLLLLLGFGNRQHNKLAIIVVYYQNGKNGKIDPLKTVESDHLKFCLQKGKKLSVGNGV